MAITELWSIAHPVLVPEISDEQIEEMRAIEPLLREPETCWYRRILGISKIHPRRSSFLWDAKPTGERLTFGPLNNVAIITFHTYGAPALFKPSLAEVYASIRRYLPETWTAVRYFCLQSENLGSEHIIGDCHWCKCILFGSPYEGQTADR